jgi:hypothetical protein
MIEVSELTKMDLHVHGHGFDKPYAMRGELLKSIEKSDVDLFLIVDKVLTKNENMFFIREKYPYGKNNDPEKLEDFRGYLEKEAGKVGKSVFFGHEIRTRSGKNGDIIVFGDNINHEVSKHLKDDDLPKSINYWVNLANKTDSGVIIPHPYMKLSSVGSIGLEKTIKSGKCHAIEVYNAAVPAPIELVFGVNRSAYDFWEENRVKHRLSGTCGTDNVEGKTGIAYCVTEENIEDSSDLIKALNSGKVFPGTIPFSRLGVINRSYENVRASVKWAATVLSGRHS